MVHPTTKPFGTVTAQDHHGLLLPYYRTGHATPTSQPISTVETRDRHALLQPAIDIDQCRFRMLEPHEVGAAMAFRPGYGGPVMAALTKRDKVRAYGNAVTPPVMAWLVGQIAHALRLTHRMATTRSTTAANCGHETAKIIALLGEPEQNIGAANGLGWSELDDAGQPIETELGDVADLKASVFLGVCSTCSAPVVTVRTWDAPHWTVEHGPAWSTRWTALVPDGAANEGQQAVTVIVDPMDDLADNLAQIEDWLRWADPDTDTAADTIGQAADLVGDLTVALRHALAASPSLRAPGGVELGPLAALPSDAVKAAHAALVAAVAELPHDKNTPAELPATMALVANCLAQAGSTDALRLAAILGRAGDQADVGPQRPAVQLSDDDYAAYRRYVTAVLTDPLLRYAATGL